MTVRIRIDRKDEITGWSGIDGIDGIDGIERKGSG